MKIWTLLFAILTAGCVTHVEPMQAPQPENATQPLPASVISSSGKTVTDKRILIDPALQKIIRLVKITSTISRDGYLKIQLNIQNLTDSFKQFRYRIDWLDERGQSLSMADVVPLEWTLLRGETSFLAATAPTPAARDFRVTFAPK
jgi:uncharacterized protein YcfL